ncbi:MAG: magnesium-translocating P-type ATPase [bacterium]|nr:magnesium-translocating P-type ATPase [bacterium]
MLIKSKGKIAEVVPNNNLKKLPTGLSRKEAQGRFLIHGPNDFGKNGNNSIILEFLGRFRNPLIYVLLGAAIVSGFSGDSISAGIIIFIVLISGTLDFVNSYRARRAAETLQSKVKVTTAVVRDGEVIEIPVSQVVPGDVVKLLPGDIISADGRVASSDDFFVNESSISGESFPVGRRNGEHIFMGSSVVTGNAYLEVEVTGRGTKFGAIVEKLKEENELSEFDIGIRDFSYLVMRTMFVLVIFVFFVNSFGKHGVLDSFLFAAALAVGLTPELLPMIITISLTKGSLAMSKHGVIVKKLSAIQNCGSMDILCTDKTGTLTEDKITLVKYVDMTGKQSEGVLWYAHLNSINRSALKNPLDAAINDFKNIKTDGYTKTEEIPFDFERRRDSIVLENQGNHIMITKGAPEGIFQICKSYGDRQHKFGKEKILLAQKEYERLSAEGFRVLAIATKAILHNQESYTKKEEHNMIFRGFVAFYDPPKNTVAHTIKLITERGVEIKILTGDNEIVSKKIADEIGLPIKGIITGKELSKLSSSEAFHDVVEKNTIFARVDPNQKTQIIKALQLAGHGVGYLGDGINDAPSLKAADVGISVNNAVDVAKEAADFILINKSLHDLINGISEGRRTFVNTLKYLKMGLSSNFGNMFSMAAASAFLPFFPMLPAQVLFNNLLYDASQFAIPLDNVDSDEILKPRKFNLKFIKKFMFIFGPISSFFDILTFAVLYFSFNFTASQFQTGWFLESIATQTFVVYVIRSRKNLLRGSRPSLPLVLSTCLAVLTAWVVGMSKLGEIFKFSPLPISGLFAIVAITCMYLFVVEIVNSRIKE